MVSVERIKALVDLDKQVSLCADTIFMWINVCLNKWQWPQEIYMTEVEQVVVQSMRDYELKWALSLLSQCAQLLSECICEWFRERIESEAEWASERVLERASVGGRSSGAGKWRTTRSTASFFFYSSVSPFPAVTKNLQQSGILTLLSTNSRYLLLSTYIHSPKHQQVIPIILTILCHQ